MHLSKIVVVEKSTYLFNPSPKYYLLFRYDFISRNYTIILLFRILKIKLTLTLRKDNALMMAFQFIAFVSYIRFSLLKVVLMERCEESKSSFVSNLKVLCSDGGEEVRFG